MKILSKRRFCIVLLLLLGSSFLTLIYYSNQSLLKCLFTHPFVPVKQSSKTTNYPFVYDSNNNDKINIADGLKSFPVVIYNRIPKTGSTSLVNLVYQLIEEKRLYTHVLHLNISTNRHYLNRRNELNLVNNLTHWTSMHPLMIHGHFAYINFKKYGSSLNPIYINMIRNPLDRLVSYYYFLRYGDDYRPYLFRKRMSDPVTRNQTFDECVRMKGSDCNPQLLWVQVFLYKFIYTVNQSVLTPYSFPVINNTILMTIKPQLLSYGFCKCGQTLISAHISIFYNFIVRVRVIMNCIYLQ
ncbi:unnamed protein product [Heterobilharzia americana]|nr:unnamed protein product [Heterobilharzia americana]